MMLCKLFHFTPCWTQNGGGWGGVCIEGRSLVIQCDSYQHLLASERTGLYGADYDSKQVRRWLTVKQNRVSKEHRAEQTREGTEINSWKKATCLSHQYTFNLAVSVVFLCQNILNIKPQIWSVILTLTLASFLHISQTWGLILTGFASKFKL